MSSKFASSDGIRWGRELPSVYFQKYKSYLSVIGADLIANMPRYRKNHHERAGEYGATYHLAPTRAHVRGA
jgi:hypothetical protein